MAQDEKPDSLDNKVDALAAMAGGEDISHQGFNAIEEPPAPSGKSDAAAALAAQTTATATPAAVPGAGSGGTAASGARKARASAMQRQRTRVHAEQFKRMMVPILLVTGILLMILGGIVGVMMRKAGPSPYHDTGGFDGVSFKKIMVIASFVIGAILLIGAWMFGADIKRGEAAARRENERDKNTEE
ncbi:MAG: hypothetical protein QGH60_16995 [Phycisphaerae bacterium]|jgi:hypothetical protein|nr:hypothetical protein [Phycisphaerae bacterium]